MKSAPKFLALFFISLFLSLNFNAYACLVPIFESMQMAQAKDCATPGKEPVTQFCDGFKTLAVQSCPDVPASIFSHLVLTGAVAQLQPDPIQPTALFSISEKAERIFPKKLPPLLCVFRI